MKKMLVTDLDGTLVEGFDITEENIKAVKKLEELGHVMTVCTGRPYNGVEFLKSKYDILVDYYILLNGALIFDRELNLIHRKEIPFYICENLISDFKETSTGVALETGFTTYIDNKGFNDLKMPNMKNIDSLNQLKNEKISLVCFEYEDKSVEYIDKICNEINEKYKDTLVAYRCTKYIDVVPLGCSKGGALELIMLKESIEANRTYSIGDSWNDVSMFKVAGNSFTFTHAEDALKKHVNFVVDSVSECVLNNMLA